MTDAEKRAAYLAWVNEETGQKYVDDESLPILVELILDKLLQMDGDQVNVKSASQGGRSITFAEGMPEKIKELMKSLRKLRW